MHRMKDHAAAVISDEEFAAVAERWPENTPDTKEAYLIRQIFDGKVSSVFWPLLTILQAYSRPKQPLIPLFGKFVDTTK